MYKVEVGREEDRQVELRRHLVTVAGGLVGWVQQALWALTKTSRHLVSRRSVPSRLAVHVPYAGWPTTHCCQVRRVIISVNICSSRYESGIYVKIISSTARQQSSHRHNLLSRTNHEYDVNILVADVVIHKCHSWMNSLLEESSRVPL